MNTRALVVLVAAALFAPALAVAGDALGQARVITAEPAGFDGGRGRRDGDFVRAGTSEDRRTAREIAADEQARSDARLRSNLGVSQRLSNDEVEPGPNKIEWTSKSHIFMGVKGALIGLIVGSFWGLAGLGVGALIGGLIGYAFSVIAARNAKPE